MRHHSRALSIASLSLALAGRAAAQDTTVVIPVQPPVPVAPATPVTPTVPAVAVPLALSASLAERRLYINTSTEPIVYDVAIGTASKPTPRGTFRIKKIVWNPAWVPPDEKWARGKSPQAPGAKKNPMKLVKIFFQEPDYYIHGTDAVESLGSAASHGCLRMHPDDAYKVARFIMENGGQPRDENWFKRVLHFRSESQTVYLDSPVTLTIN